jgi:hypothetical protein
LAQAALSQAGQASLEKHRTTTPPLSLKSNNLLPSSLLAHHKTRTASFALVHLRPHKKRLARKVSEDTTERLQNKAMHKQQANGQSVCAHNPSPLSPFFFFFSVSHSL